MASEPRQGRPMRQKAIDFRELIEHLLPLDELPPTDRLRVRRALQTGISAQLEQAALYALSRLEQTGAVRRMPVAENGKRTLRWQTRDALGVITLEQPGPRERAGLLVVPRSSLPDQAQAGLDQVRRLLRLDEALLASDPRSGQARRGLFEQVDHAGRELLCASEVRFVPVGDEAASPEPLAPALAAEARARPDVLLYCPDTEHCPALALEGRRRRVRSVVIVAAASSEGQALRPVLRPVLPGRTLPAGGPALHVVPLVRPDRRLPGRAWVRCPSCAEPA